MISKHAKPDIILFKLFGFILSILLGISISNCLMIGSSISNHVIEYMILGFVIGGLVYFINYKFYCLEKTLINVTDLLEFYIVKELCIGMFTTIYISVYIDQITTDFFLLITITTTITGLIRISQIIMEKYLWTPRWNQKKINV